jgi:hypothetical protein
MLDCCEKRPTRKPGARTLIAFSSVRASLPGKRYFACPNAQIDGGEAKVSDGSRDREVLNRKPLRHPSRTGPHAVRDAVAHSVALGFATLATYLIITKVLPHVYSLSRDDDLLGGMWAVIATIFVYHDTYRQSIAAALSRIAATSVSFILCFVYLLLLPFHAWGLALLIALGALAVRLAGRPGDAITTAITTAVVLVVAEVSPHDAWQQPILRWVDTIIGVAVAVAAWGIAAAATDGRRTDFGRAHVARQPASRPARLE